MKKFQRPARPVRCNSGAVYRTLNAYAACVLVLAGFAGCATKPEKRDADYPYHFPLSSPGEKFGGLPPAVQTSVRAQVGAAEIYDVRKNTKSGRVVYEVLFQNPDLYPPLYVASDGSVLYPDMTLAVGAAQETIGAESGGPVSGVKVGDLPSNVANTIQEKAPTSEVAFVNKITVGDAIFYEVTLKNNGAKLLIAEDGTLVTK